MMGVSLLYPRLLKTQKEGHLKRLALGKDVQGYSDIALGGQSSSSCNVGGGRKKWREGAGPLCKKAFEKEYREGDILTKIHRGGGKKEAEVCGEWDSSKWNSIIKWGGKERRLVRTQKKTQLDISG